MYRKNETTVVIEGVQDIEVRARDYFDQFFLWNLPKEIEQKIKYYKEDLGGVSSDCGYYFDFHTKSPIKWENATGYGKEDNFAIFVGQRGINNIHIPKTFAQGFGYDETKSVWWMALVDYKRLKTNEMEKDFQYHPIFLHEHLETFIEEWGMVRWKYLHQFNDYKSGSYNPCFGRLLSILGVNSNNEDDAKQLCESGFVLRDLTEEQVIKILQLAFDKTVM